MYRRARPFMSLALTACGLVVATAALTSCATSINTKKVEKALVADLTSNNDVGAAIGAAVCPDKIKPKAGDTFECTVEIDGQPAHYTLTQKDAKGNLRWNRTDAVIDLSKVEDEVTAGLLDQLKVAATVDCGKGKVKLVKPGDTFTCKAAAETDMATIEVTAEDLSGKVAWKLKQ